MIKFTETGNRVRAPGPGRAGDGVVGWGQTSGLEDGQVLEMGGGDVCRTK